MTRLTSDDVETLRASLAQVESQFREVCGLGLLGLALRAAGVHADDWATASRRAAAVPVSTGEGVIPGFCECVVAVLRHLGVEAWVTEQPDVRGLQEAVDGGADAVFMADDHRFIALGLATRRCVDDDPATAHGYVEALAAAAGGLEGREVLLLGLGPVGRAAARRLLDRGARVLVVEPDEARRAAALAEWPELVPVSLEEGVARCRLLFDATPAADLVDAGDVGEATVAAVPGVPSGFTRAAQERLGPRHLHEPLAVGVAVMAVRALVPAAR